MIRTLNLGDAKRGLLVAARLLLGPALVLLVLTLFAACDGGDDTDVEPTALEPTATAEEGTATPGDSVTPGSETGEGPIFWRTEDDFRSLRAGEPYKVGFRVTNGYAEDTLRVVAEGDGGAREEFEAPRVQPVGEEEPGAFYHLLLELAEPGTWQLTVVAGDDGVAITVEVGPAASPTG